MNFYDNINNLVASFKKTEEYLEYTLDELLPLAFTGKNLE